MTKHDDGVCDGCPECEECDCEYPHGHDFEPPFETCTCEPGCFHVVPLFPDGFPEMKETR